VKVIQVNFIAKGEILDTCKDISGLFYLHRKEQQLKERMV